LQPALSLRIAQLKVQVAIFLRFHEDNLARQFPLFPFPPARRVRVVILPSGGSEAAMSAGVTR
jgi:hypothetical protein